jgi:hypothetical protein
MIENRQHPFFSPIGCLGGLVLIVGILAAVWFSGGAIFSPGDLTAYGQGGSIQGFASHADFQNDCTQCHAPGIGIEPERCQACHAAIGQERARGSGLHGRLKPEDVVRCDTCHPDHEGRDLNPNANAILKFDHAIVGFTLARHIVNYESAALTCRSCHTAAGFNFEAATCVNCHSAHDLNFMLDHVRAFGQACRICHDGVDQTRGFDHAQTRFPLDGQHAEMECAACHMPEMTPKDTPLLCAGCHAEPPGHKGVFSHQDCAACHHTTTWSPAGLGEQPAFRHTDTAFQLINHAKNFDGSAITCVACHSQASAGGFGTTTQRCVNCHGSKDAAFMTQHVQQYGMNCVSCHDGAGNMKNFDHSQVFALEGAHAALECTACHQQQTFHGTPRECMACHAEPPLHAGLFGTTCEACHTATAWAPARLMRHIFPLAHGSQGEVACTTCHTETYAKYTCYGCHEHEPALTQAEHEQEGITGDRLLECAVCHPTGLKEEGDDKHGN